MENPTTLTLDDLRAMPAGGEPVVTLECAGNGRLRQTPLTGGPGGGWLSRQQDGEARSCTRCSNRRCPATNAVEVKFEGADHGRYQQYGDLTFVRSLALDHATDAVAEDPDRLRDERRAVKRRPRQTVQARSATLVGVASVKWLKRIEVTTEPFQGEFEARHYMYEWADRPSERVHVMPVRALITDPRRAPAFRRVATGCAERLGPGRLP